MSRGAVRADLAILIDFNEKVARLERTRFAKRYKTDLPEVLMTFEDLKITHLGNGKLNFFGKLKSRVPEFDEDEIDAFVLTYRMLSQNNDRLSLANVSDLYCRDWMPEEASARFREAREHLNEYLDSAATMEFGPNKFAIRELVDIVIYGGLAHSNAQKSEIFKAWSANEAIVGLMWVEFQAAMRKALYVFSFLRQLNEAVISADI